MTDTTAADLRRLGWRIVSPADLREAIEDFQRGYCLPGRPALLVDGKAGAKTRAEIAQSIARLKAGKPTASKWFSWTEFACKCGGRYTNCRRIRVHRALLLALTEYREAVGRPVRIASGYRCPSWNQRQGGASSSQHLYGAAVDVEYALSYRPVARLRAFSGIGKSKSTGKVRHLDVRHVSGNNTTGGTPDRPTTWNYAT